MHPTTIAILEFFEYDHLREPLRATSVLFHSLAHKIAGVPGPETTVALRKLLEAKDAAVRAKLKAPS